MSLAPRVEGTLPIRSAPARFEHAVRERIAAGLLTGRPHPRSNYHVADAAAGRLLVRAADWWTATNVGLNELELRLSQPGSVHYRVSYWPWARFALGLSGLLGLVGLAVLLTADVRGYIARHPAGMVRGLSADQNVLVAWAMVVFWGFVWPWVLVALHKRPLRRLVARLIAELDSQAASGRTT